MFSSVGVEVIATFSVRRRSIPTQYKQEMFFRIIFLSATTIKTPPRYAQAPPGQTAQPYPAAQTGQTAGTPQQGYAQPPMAMGQQQYGQPMGQQYGQPMAQAAPPMAEYGGQQRSYGNSGRAAPY